MRSRQRHMRHLAASTLQRFVRAVQQWRRQLKARNARLRAVRTLQRFVRRWPPNLARLTGASDFKLAVFTLPPRSTAAAGPRRGRSRARAGSPGLSDA